MRRIFNAFLFLFLDFSFYFGASRVGLIPDFVGYLLILPALDEMAAYNRRFARIKPYAIGMAVYTGALYLLDLTGLSVAMGFLPATVLELASTVATLIITHEIVTALMEIEAASGQDLRADFTKRVWTLQAVLMIVGGTVLYIVPELSVPFEFVLMILGIFFLFTFSKTVGLFEARQFKIPMLPAADSGRKKP